MSRHGRHICQGSHMGPGVMVRGRNNYWSSMRSSLYSFASGGICGSSQFDCYTVGILSMLFIFTRSLQVVKSKQAICSNNQLPRDRTWSLHQIQGRGSSLSTSMVARTDKKTSVHTRLIWACAWAPDGKYFLTVRKYCKYCLRLGA